MMAASSDLKSWLDFESFPHVQHRPWIPLRQAQEMHSTPNGPMIASVDEYFGLASAAIASAHRSDADELGWSDLDLSNHRPNLEGGTYVPCDVVESKAGDAIGVHLVIDNYLEDQRKNVWRLNPDIEVALRRLGFEQLVRSRFGMSEPPTHWSVGPFPEAANDYLAYHRQSVFVRSA